MKQLQVIKRKKAGRNARGQVVVRHKGGEHKRYLRMIDFKRDKRDISAKVVALEYDPNRTGDICRAPALRAAPRSARRATSAEGRRASGRAARRRAL